MLEGYKEFDNEEDSELGILYDEVIGLLREDKKFPVIYAYRHIIGLNKIVPIQFDRKFEIESIRELFQKAVNIDKSIGERIIEIGFEYYKSLGKINEYFANPDLKTIDKFKKTIELQTVSIYRDVNSGIVSYGFRPSWDEEHGLSIKFNFNTMIGEVSN